jgi:hypothetical protein
MAAQPLHEGRPGSRVPEFGVAGFGVHGFAVIAADRMRWWYWCRWRRC